MEEFGEAGDSGECVKCVKSTVEDGAVEREAAVGN